MESKSSDEFWKRAATPTLASDSGNEEQPGNDANIKPYSVKSKLPWPLSIGHSGDGLKDYVV